MTVSDLKADDSAQKGMIVHTHTASWGAARRQLTCKLAHIQACLDEGQSIRSIYERYADGLSISYWGFAKYVSRHLKYDRRQSNGHAAQALAAAIAPTEGAPLPCPAGPGFRPGNPRFRFDTRKPVADEDFI